MNLIRYATIQGEKYPINTDFKVAIECDRVINDPDVDDFERGVAIVTLLFGDVPYCDEALQKASLFLSGGEEGEKAQERIIDFVQHWDLIYSAFKGQYGIDLHKDEMHYQEFMMLLRGVKNSALSDVVDVLSRNPAEEKDYKTRKQLIEAQNKLKIKQAKPQAPKNSAFLNALAPQVKGGLSDG